MIYRNTLNNKYAQIKGFLPSFSLFFLAYAFIDCQQEGLDKLRSKSSKSLFVKDTIFSHLNIHNGIIST